VEYDDLRGLVIINHQRQLAPLQRVHAHVFQDDVVTTARGQRVTLMTAWELFRIARNARRLGWTHDDVAPLLYVDGRPDIVPADYQPIGEIDACWPRASAFAVSLSAPLRTGDRLAIETPVDFIGGRRCLPAARQRSGRPGRRRRSRRSRHRRRHRDQLEGRARVPNRAYRRRLDAGLSASASTSSYA